MKEFKLMYFFSECFPLQRYPQIQRDWLQENGAKWLDWVNWKERAQLRG